LLDPAALAVPPFVPAFALPACPAALVTPPLLAVCGCSPLLDEQASANVTTASAEPTSIKKSFIAACI
jgi:hypothetical protein